MRTNLILSLFIILISCGKDKPITPSPEPPTPTQPNAVTLIDLSVDEERTGYDYVKANIDPSIRYKFSEKIDKSTAEGNIVFKSQTGDVLNWNARWEDNDSTLIIQTTDILQYLQIYTIEINTNLASVQAGKLREPITVKLGTKFDSTDKFPRVSDEALLTLVQQHTFRYFWDFAHPESGLIRERSNGDNHVVTTGGTGLGVMAIVTGIHRAFITRAEGLERTQKIVSFLKDVAQTYKGAFPYWLNGSTGVTIPFTNKDDGADIVETSLLMQGLLTARQFFNSEMMDELQLRADINEIWERVEWNAFQKDGENVLYRHWSENYGWDMNFQIRGWNESLITYMLAASSPTNPINKPTYDQGWGTSDAMVNGKDFYNINLPLGPDYGGPLLFSHYSFLGLNPFGLTDVYANYETQVKNHSLINYNYAVANPKSFYGYGENMWGLTTSDTPDGYTASSPTNDLSIIAPTAAISSLPYTPEESMKALHFFYYTLGDKLFKDYGFVDAFSLEKKWFANTHRAIEQGPIILMIENHRSGLLWNLFMSCPELQDGMATLGFSSTALPVAP